MSDPFDGGLQATNGGRFQGAIQKSWIRGGFAAMSGKPVLRQLPTLPVSGETYANHPPLFHWSTYLVVRFIGLSEVSLRLLPALSCALTGALLVFFLLASFGNAGHLVAILYFAMNPMTFFYGMMPNYESTVSLLALIAFLLHRQQSDSPWNRRFACIALFTGIWVDWSAAFVLPGIICHDILLHRVKRNLKLYGSYFLAVALAVLSYFVLLSIWQGGPVSAFGRLKSAQATASVTASFEFADLISAQLTHVTSLFGWPAVILSLCGFIVLVFKRSKANRGLLALHVVWLIFTATNIALFPRRALNHDFWWYFFVPSIVVFVAWCVDITWRRARMLGVLCAGALLIGAIVPLQQKYDYDQAGSKRGIATELNRFLSCDDLLLSPYPGSWFFYTNAWVYDSLRNENEVREIVNQFRDGKLNVKRVVLICDPQLRRNLSEKIASAEEDGKIETYTFGDSIAVIWTH